MDAYNAYCDPDTKPQRNQIVNNIINTAAGSNINIKTEANSQNNFIFNNTAPISFNFYRE